MRKGKIAVALIVMASVSLVMAMVFVRAPALWPLMPMWFSDGVASILAVKTQEQDANAEFLAAWIWCFAFLAVLAFTALLVRPKKKDQ
jgi:hypothetical protein